VHKVRQDLLENQDLQVYKAQQDPQVSKARSDP
jgi:hypothetical protein